MADNAPFQVSAPAGSYYRAMSASLSQVPESTRLVLQRDVGGSPLAWALALVLAGWRRLEQGGSLPVEFVDSGADKLVSQIRQFKSAFPKSFTSFLDAADRGEDAAAASYFQNALTDLADYARPVLNSWLSSQPFMDAARKLVASIGGAPQRPGKAPKSDSSGYGVDPGIASATDRTAILLGRLAAAGWDQDSINKILAGPDQAPLTADRLYRQIAANDPSVQDAFRAKFSLPSTPLAAANLQVDPAQLQGSKARLTGTEQLMAEFNAMPPAQQQKLLALLQQKQSFPNPDVGQIGKRPSVGTTNQGGKTQGQPASDTSKIADAVKSGLDLANATIKGILGQSGSKTASGAKSGKAGSKTQDDTTDDADTGDSGTGVKSDTGNSTSKSRSKGGAQSKKDDNADNADNADKQDDQTTDDSGNNSSLPDDSGAPPGPDKTDSDTPIIDDSADVVD